MLALAWHRKRKSCQPEPLPNTVQTSCTGNQSKEAGEQVPPAPVTSLVQETFDPVKVNNANAVELKIACDDAVKRFFSRPDQYKVQYTHTDVKLGLGWTSVLIAAATGLYGWKTEFEKAKPLIWLGVTLYTILTAIQAAYTYFVEGKTIFVGKRKTLSSRIETEKITIDAETSLSPSSSPLYCLSLTYVRSSNSGKTLIRRTQLNKQERPYTSLFDSEGNFDQSRFTAWLHELSLGLVDDKPSDSKEEKADCD
ncbi:microsomal signal peptidase 25 kDa subunit-domain-containing protein [Cantharellus anzutake]|uniref:microsomal signal peptidase 25 kDa subunit-domain-containing protein n=1 Tax=Cantharellus anzutake TaxID=1750568 RepID=UPI001905D6CA|nr:microsomal signal peptidase 25 kDa subunit-domain-containing protein [Cantharellus anzutake]KAF8325018.1 microsomal signal peptidase 25 kDa subunit-domain-containing protein [Cantharellus anzutake]